MRTSVLEELVALPSISGQEEVIAAHTAAKCKAPGRAITRIGDNVAVHIPGADPTKAMLLNGHTDTVPPVEGWKTDPFKLQPDPRNKDRLIGLGASDMKAGIGVMLDIAEEAKHDKPPVDIWLLFSSKEETDSSGSVELADWLARETRKRYITIGGLILEPTNAEFFGVGHRGDTLWDVTAYGPGGHASQEFISETPIERVSRFISALPVIRRNWQAHYAHGILREPSINVTVFNAGATTNVVPTKASATLNLRVTPQLANELPEIRTSLERKYEVSIQQHGVPSPTLCAPKEHIYKVAKTILPDVPFQAFPGATDQFAFHNHGMPMLIYGPGDPKAMHLAGEWVSQSAIKRCKRMIQLVLKHF